MPQDIPFDWIEKEGDNKWEDINKQENKESLKDSQVKIELLEEENFLLKNELEISKNQLTEAEEVISR